MSELRGRGNDDSSWRTRRSCGVGSDGGSGAFSECGTRSGWLSAADAGDGGGELESAACAFACREAGEPGGMELG